MIKLRKHFNLLRNTVASIAVLTASCQKEPPVDTANREGILLVGNASEPKGLDPHLVSGTTESNILRALFEGLCRDHPSDDAACPPGVAERYDSNDTSTVWTFHLRKDAQWSDGKPLTADDFVFAYHRILNPELAGPYGEMLYYMTNAEKYNKNKVFELMCQNIADFPLKWEDVKGGHFSTNKSVNIDDFKDESYDSLSREQKKMVIKHKGLDALSLTILKSIQSDLSLVEWPKNTADSTRSTVIDELVKVREHYGDDVWDMAKVGVIAVDDYTLRIELRGPTPHLPKLTKHFTWYPVPKHVILKHGKGKMYERYTGWTDPENIVSNGPFRLKSWRMNHSVEVEANPYYWGKDEVSLKGVRFLPISNPYTETRMFYDNQLHLTANLSAENYDRALKEIPEQVRHERYIGTKFLRCNVNIKPLDNPNIRRALNLAIDRDTLTQKVLKGHTPATSFVPPMDDYKSPQLVTFDPKKAAELMAKEGYANGKGFPKLKLLIASRETSKTMAEALQAEWKKHLGIEIEIINKEWSAYLEAMQSLEYDLADGGWIGDFLHPTTFLDMWTDGNNNNRTGWSNKNYEEALDEAQQIPQLGPQAKVLGEAERILLEERPILPISWYSKNYLIHPSVENYHPLLLNNHPYRDIKLNAKAK